MSYDLELAQKALDDYNAKYDNDKYMAITWGVAFRTPDEDTQFRINVSDCALLLCGHPGIPQSRWTDLLDKLPNENFTSRWKVSEFLALFIPQAPVG